MKLTPHQAALDHNPALAQQRRANICVSLAESGDEQAKASGIATARAAELRPLDGTRTSERTLARFSRMRYRCRRLAYKPNHAIDLDAEGIIAAEVRPADQGGTITFVGTLEVAACDLRAASTSTSSTPADLVDGGEDDWPALKSLAADSWPTRSGEPELKEVPRRHGDDETGGERCIGRRSAPELGRRQEGFRLRAEGVNPSLKHIRGRLRHPLSLTTVAGRTPRSAASASQGVQSPPKNPARARGRDPRRSVARGGLRLWISCLPAGSGVTPSLSVTGF